MEESIILSSEEMKTYLQPTSIIKSPFYKQTTLDRIKDVDKVIFMDTNENS